MQNESLLLINSKMINISIIYERDNWIVEKLRFLIIYIPLVFVIWIKLY